MKKVMMIFVSLSLLLLAAHFLRFGNWDLCLAIISLAGLMFYRLAWVRWVLIAVLTFAILVWADTGLNLIRMRLAANQPWLRLSLIIATVITLTIYSVAMLLMDKSKAFFSRDAYLGIPLSVIFLLTTLTLGLARHMASLPILLADRFLPGSGWLEILFIGLYATWVGKKMISTDKTSLIRSRIWGFFSLIFFAQLLLGLVGIQEMLMTGRLHLPVPMLIVAGPLYRGSGLFMLMLFTVTVLLVGPAWCSYLCYIGPWDDYLCKRKKKRSNNLPSWLNQGRIYMLILVVAAAVALRIWGVFSWVAGASALIFGIIGVGIMVGLSTRWRMMVHCTAYCPIGIISNLMGKINPWRLRINPDCNQCGACRSACCYNALSMKNIKKKKPGITCTLCGDCIASCKDRYISYQFPGLTPLSARKAFFVMCITLHAVFLGVARI